MARKDNKGRNLKTGESQRPDGRYMYRYKDELTGKRVTIYDMDLASLREQEKKINKDIDDQLITDTSVKKIADYAEARVVVGRRVLYNVDKIKKYLDAMAV